MEKQFPRTVVDGVSLSRMIIGTNWILGYSHTTSAADKEILEFHSDPNRTAEMLCLYQAYGIDTIMGPLGQKEDHILKLLKAIKIAEDKCGKPFILIDTPRINVDDNADARREAEAVIKYSKEVGTTLCFPHHSSAEQLVNKNLQQIPRLPDYLQMVRDHGMIPGLSAHMPELIVYSDQNEYDVQSYVQIYNCAGFLMQIEIESVHSIIHKAKKPVMTIKSMAAGRVSPFVGLTFSWKTLRDCDMVTVGAFKPLEVLEDIEFSFAALENRVPDLAGRSSPSRTSIMK